MPKRVVIAEDNWLTPTVLRTELEAHGFEVVGIARTGMEAIQLCRDHGPDVVLMDIRMPEMSGIEATRVLMEECPTCVIMVTGDSSYMLKAEEIGAMDYLVKPFMPDEIITIVTAASVRFGFFRRVREGSANANEALQTWQFVHRAMKRLSAQSHLSEEEAFRALEGAARERGTSVRQEAEAVIAEAEHPSAV